MADILIVDDEVKIGTLLSAELADEGHQTRHTSDPREALRLVESSPPDILITDLRMDGIDGIELLNRSRTIAPHTDVVVMTAYATVETAVAAIRGGAYDYIIKPFKTEELVAIVDRVEERRRLQSENQGLKRYITGRTDEEMIGESPTMRRVKEVIAGLGPSDAAVLIRGDSGTGKELVARAIHRASHRAAGPFIALNCAAIPETLLESELFGYEKGAFTGATRRKIGHFQMADGGTLFLDEIGDLPAPLQAKLLRVLENHRFTPVGALTEIAVDIRLISATHRPLEAEIREGRFREDLFYRLNVFPVRLPPLRERKDDIESIARHFLELWRRDPAHLTRPALERLLAYDWPGNIRELRNVLERAVILRPNGDIGAADILLTDTVAAPIAGAETTPPLDSMNLEEVERELIVRALHRSGGNKSEAARLLGITRRTLYGRMERYGFD